MDFFSLVWMRKTLINLTVFSRKPFRPNLTKCPDPFKTFYTCLHLFLIHVPGTRTYHALSAQLFSLLQAFLVYQRYCPSRVFVTEAWPWKCFCTHEITQTHLAVPLSLLCFKEHFLPPPSCTGKIPHTVVSVTVALQGFSLLTADYLSTKHFLTWVTFLKGISPAWVCNVSVEHLLHCYSPAWNPCSIWVHQL